MASINGIQLHYVRGGQGDPIVLLHGWPQTWYEWRHVMPVLLRIILLIAPISEVWIFFKASTGYDATLLQKISTSCITDRIQ